MTRDEALEIVKKEKEDRAARCLESINEVLTKERCRISVAFLITPEANIPQVNIVPID